MREDYPVRRGARVFWLAALGVFGFVLVVSAAFLQDDRPITTSTPPPVVASDPPPATSGQGQGDPIVPLASTPTAPAARPPASDR